MFSLDIIASFRTQEERSISKWNRWSDRTISNSRSKRSDISCRAHRFGTIQRLALSRSGALFDRPRDSRAQNSCLGPLPSYISIAHLHGAPHTCLLIIPIVKTCSDQINKHQRNWTWEKEDCNHKMGNNKLLHLVDDEIFQPPQTNIKRVLCTERWRCNMRINGSLSVRIWFLFGIYPMKLFCNRSWWFR